MKRTVYLEDHEAFRAMARTFLEREVVGHIDEFRAGHAIGRDVWRKAGEAGLLGLEIPEEYGGSAPEDYRFNAVFIEELSKVTMGLASSLSIHFDVVVPYLVRFGTPEQRERWLPRMATGELVSAIAMTEPSGGTDLGALKTRATRVDRGWLVSGSKTFITNGASAGLVLVAARTGGGPRTHGISLFAIDFPSEGFSRGRKLEKVGQPEADTAELFFEDVRVAEDQLIGELDRGFAHMMRLLPQERLGSAVCNLAHARRILDETLEYARAREAFGQPIGSFQHLKFLLAELVTKVEVTQAYVDDCVTAHAAGDLSAVDAAKAKWWTAEIQNEVLDHCVQVHGGYGYMTEYRAARAWQDARVTKIWAGSNEIMKELIGRDLGL
ncbi:acyl-CoA dehydrogenase family protein [Jiangella anatolica]|uniref:Acyl-CoA dehydrogenase n=1 Tax=Jiangella anatolica TaxID=2670374 RepID=A0A2W2C956_9ACTN|nr:acyl-CoA dehydrogenase family protein [Jiangella anatolica]PZF82346.1 acyl-CoA dehydrogenase [Jiangella anatolica]